MKALVPALAIVMTACTAAVSSSKAPPPVAPIDGNAPSAPRATSVDAEAARRLVAAGVKVLDVRTPAEFAAGHVPGAVNIPYDELPRRAAELGAPSTPVLLYCRSGRRSGIAARTLLELGFSQLWDLGQYDLWVRSEPAPQAPRD